MSKLKNSGYTHSDRIEILKSGINSYNKLKQKEKDGIRPFYRSKEFEINKRKAENKDKKANWFSKDEKSFKTVIFVEPSPYSELIECLKETETKYHISENERIKFIEKAGKKTLSLMKVSNTFKENCAPEDNCHPCKNNEDLTYCKKSNVGYRIICKLCEHKRKISDL